MLNKLEFSKERRNFFHELAGQLDENERSELARYIASTPSGLGFSPFYSPVSFDVTTREGLRRQNIAVAIAPQSFEKDLIQNFLSQEGIRRENFLLAMANLHLRDSMPLGALMAGEYRITLQYPPSDRKEVSMREALEKQIERSYTEKPIGIESRGLLPLEELACLVVVDGLRQLPQEDLQSRFNQITPQILQAENPLAVLEQAFPDIRLWFDKREMGRLNTDINTLKKAVAEPNQVPPRDFWSSVLTKPDKIYGYFTQVRDSLVCQIYQTGGENHLKKWRDLVKAFVVSEGQERAGDTLTLTLASDHEIGISEKDGPLFSLVRRDDGQWYPSSYWDRKSQKSIFAVEGMSYEELQKMIANNPLRYQVENDFLREVLRVSLNELAARVYDQIREQVDLETINKAGFHPSHAAIAYREEGPLRDFQYLIGGMTPYSVGIYNSIFSAFVRHLWQHGKLTETDLSINVPLTGELVTVRHPLLELQGVSLEEIQRRLKETGSDVRVPEITIRRSGGYELRAKAWVYETLLELKELGFDAVLGKTKAEEFNRQAARIYVESTLTDLGFLAEDYQREKPLAALQDRQQRLYSKALASGFKVQINEGYYLARSLSLPLTWERERTSRFFKK